MGFSRAARIKTLLVIDVLFFFIELITGYAVGSLALVADSFHMLNDVLSLVVSLYAIKMSTNASDKNYSYGWRRAEILSALVNGVFLLALCFSIFMEAIERFFSTPDISNPRLVVIVGSWGLLSNIIGLILFHEHGHDHSAGPAVDLVSRVQNTEEEVREWNSIDAHGNRRFSIDSHNRNSPESDDATASSSTHDRDTDEHTPLIGNQYPSKSKAAGGHGHSHSKSGSMNMRSLVLHVLGDALGNVGVIATGLVIWLTNWKFKYYFDPIISLVITVIIFSTALPLVRSASFILLQGVPPSVSLDSVRKAILKIPGVLSVHELHVWQLSEAEIVASVHVTISDQPHFMPIAKEICETLHKEGIHSTTIQPEYDERYSAGSDEHLLKTTEDTDCLVHRKAQTV